MGPPPRSFAADAHHCIMVRVVRHPPNTSMWRDPRANQAGSPRQRHPDHTKCAVVLGAVKVWPGDDGSCVATLARRPTLTAPLRATASGICGSGEETGSRSNKETDEEKR
jgi:hypothetical protein